MLGPMSLDAVACPEDAPRAGEAKENGLMTDVPAGWYPDSNDPTQLRYWDGSNWTERTAPAQQAAYSPVIAHAPFSNNIYDQSAELLQAHLTPEQRAQYQYHTLTRFPTWVAVLLHFLTLGLFSIIYQGLKLSKLPLIKDNDFKAGKGIGFLFIPFFNYYWIFRFTLALADRLNFQYRLRGQLPRVSRGFALACCIVQVIPYVGVLSWLILWPILVGQLQSATNRLAGEREGRALPMGVGAVPPPALQPPPSPPAGYAPPGETPPGQDR
jgi:hypothetical protein